MVIFAVHLVPSYDQTKKHILNIKQARLRGWELQLCFVFYWVFKFIVYGKI